ncbi:MULTISPECIES: LuxR family transcriptional regulator [Burkholderia]|uniref:LuxR family transcriptional regulator n=1 Tax=Burkholderia aenigmatica TaxID=2015348 RepID=A0A228IXQ1_9BURK|nr:MULTISPECIES: LuxR family transcriptional regulator [Burkholderia]MBN3841939.1 LuxR family transcriptional regulator [Burkholderia sp. Ac-20349]OXI47084.1 LuxR family transcriptional regulator [Burkholderia aenigmatica]
MKHDLYLFENLLTATSREELHNGVVKLAGEFGFPSLFFSPLVDSGGAKKFFRDHGQIAPEHLPARNIYTTYPESWLVRYQQAEHIHRDPVVRQATQTTLPIYWDRSSQGRNVVFDEAREHGLAEGITIPIHGANGEWSLFSVASDSSLRHDRSHASAFVGQIQLSAFYMSEAARRLGEPTGLAIRALTKREKECLLWAAQGKTSWEIGNILSISEPTVVFHLTNAKNKLQATNRRQAVAKAISLRLIQP